MTAQINKIAQRYGVQLVNDEIAYTSTEIYRGQIPPHFIAHSISKDVFVELGISITVGILIIVDNKSMPVYGKYIVAKHHPNGEQGHQR